MGDRIDLGVELDGYVGEPRQPPTGYDAHPQPLTDLQAQGFDISAPRAYGEPLLLPTATANTRCAQCGRYLPDIIGGTDPTRCDDCRQNWEDVKRRIDRSKRRGGAA